MMRMVSFGVVWVSALFLGACGPSFMSTSEATSFLIEQLTTEDAAVLAICRQLEAVPASSAQIALSERARAAVAEESAQSLAALLQALGVERGVCDPQRMLAGEAAPACEGSIQARFLALGEGLEGERGQPKEAERQAQRLYRALRNAGVDAAALVSQPMAVVQAMDLSPAVVAGVVYFADQTSRYVGEMVGSLGLASGLARLAAEQIAAEMLAVTIQAVLDALEQQGLVQRSSAARAACHLYVGASSRPVVTVRLLKRLVLRFQSQAHTTYAIAGPCKRYSGVCDTLIDAAGLPESRFPTGTLLPTAPSTYDALVPTLESPPGPQPVLAAQEQVASQAHALLNATDHCGDQCDLAAIGAGAGAFLVAQALGGDTSAARIAEQVEEAERSVASNLDLQQDLAGLSQDVARLQAKVESTRSQLSIQGLAAERFQRDVMTVLLRLSKCEAQIEAVVRERVRIARETLGVAEAIDCGRPKAALDYASARFPGLRVEHEAICEPTRTFDISFTTDDLFPVCSDQMAPEKGEAMDDLFRILVTLQPASVLLIGHADQRPITSGTCLRRFRDNHGLSQARAEAVRDALNLRLAATQRSLALEAMGFGAERVLRDCSHDDTEACHGSNRRITLQIVGARSVDFDFSCVSAR